jgi:multiple sugar transport system substrate-binding protein
MMKKTLVPIMVSAVMLALSACGGGATSPAQESKAPAADSKPIVLKFSLWGSDAYKAMYEDLAKKYTEKNPNIKVEVMLIPFTEYQQKLSIMSASGDMPDVGWLAERMVPQFVESNQLIDIQSAVTSDAAYDFNDLIPVTLEQFKKDNKLYGISFSSQPGALYVNNTLFKEKGLKTPMELVKEGKWTWEELIKAGKVIADPDKGVYGIKLLADWKRWSDATLDLIWAHGGDIMSKDGKFIMNTPETEKALQMYYDMIFKDKIHPKPGDQTSFESGKLAMYRDNYGYASKVRPVKSFEWDIAPLPKGTQDGPYFRGQSGISVFATTKHPKEATDLLKYLTNKEAASVYTKFIVPTRKSVLQSDAFLKADAIMPPADSMKAVYIDTAAKTRLAPSHENWIKIDSKMLSLYELMYTGNEPVKSMLQRAEKEVNALLK